MKITRMDVFAVSYTLAGGRYSYSGGRSVDQIDSTLVKLSTDQGLAGWGEACTLGASYMVGHPQGTRAALKELAPAVLGQDPSQPPLLATRLDAALRGHLYAKSALDMACWDLAGQAADLPISVLLGGRYRDDYELYMAISMGPPQDMAERVAGFRQQGYRRFQLKVGGDPLEDVARVRAGVDGARPGAGVVVDANGGWSMQQAARVARAIEGLDVYLEQPCATLEECLAIRARTTLPMILDEIMADVPTLLRAYQHRAMEGINLKLARVGGLTRARQVRDLCETLGISVTIEDAMGGDVASAAIAHLVAGARPETLFIASVVIAYVLDRLAEGAPRAVRARARIPSGPGLGIRVDESRLGAPLFSAP
jgi:L-alanine-DL-glutamate epimerase-like enolase superfamily enzyme